MAWGGSLNKNGTDYLRKLRELENTVRILEKLKENLSQEKKRQLDTAIDIIVDYMNELSRGKKKN
ncbi:MAG: hypothetical protein JW891_15860 [Candidatus Lokiarchaeota archaeon]|nr:hypothetical protein [Candidatus Lokiarchaeota archaeon]